VLKGEGLAHKTEAVAVALNLADPPQRGCGCGMPAQLPGRGDGRRWRGRMLVGVLRDPAHGFVLTLGAGGVLTELLADSVSLLLPVDTARDRAPRLTRLRIAPLLAGIAGEPGCDREALVDAVMAVQDCAEPPCDPARRGGDQPANLHATTAVAVDALIRIGETDHDREPDQNRARGACWRSRSTGPRPTRSTSPPAAIMGEVFTDFRDDPDLRVAIITGAGEKFFCPGWDLKAAADGDAVDGDYGKGGFGGLQELRG
jgi:hypothetical protein